MSNGEALGIAGKAAAMGHLGLAQPYARGGRARQTLRCAHRGLPEALAMLAGYHPQRAVAESHFTRGKG